MIRGIGTDVVDLARIRTAYHQYGDKFLQKVLAPGERDACRAYAPARQVEFLAGRFAAKEAMAKAAGCGLGKLGMNQVEIVLGDRGLNVKFLNEANHHATLSGRWHVSISHTDKIAFAAAILEVDTELLDE